MLIASPGPDPDREKLVASARTHYQEQPCFLEILFSFRALLTQVLATAKNLYGHSGFQMHRPCLENPARMLLPEPEGSWSIVLALDPWPPLLHNLACTARLEEYTLVLQVSGRCLFVWLVTWLQPTSTPVRFENALVCSSLIHDLSCVVYVAVSEQVCAFVSCDCLDHQYRSRQLLCDRRPHSAVLVCLANAHQHHELSQARGREDPGQPG